MTRYNHDLSREFGYRAVASAKGGDSAIDVSRRFYERNPKLFPVQRMPNLPVGVRSNNLRGSLDGHFFQVEPSETHLLIRSDYQGIVTEIKKRIEKS